jgi:hypothetical protein
MACTELRQRHAPENPNLSKRPTKVPHSLGNIQSMLSDQDETSQPFAE